MSFGGCLKEKINVIRPLEKVLSDFEKKVSTFFEPKIFMIAEKFSAYFLFLNFFRIQFLTSDASKNFLKHLLHMI